MKRTLHLHIGLPKTASTTLQFLLLENRELLQEHGFDYPVPAGLNNPGNATPLVNFFHNDRVANKRFAFHNPDFGEIGNISDFVDLAYLSNRAEHIILSAEGLHRFVQMYDYDFLFSRFHKVRAYIALRPKANWLESHYFQRVKIGDLRQDFHEHLERGDFERQLTETLAYSKIYSYWSRKLGTENVELLFLGERFDRIENQFISAMLNEVPSNLVLPNVKNAALGIEAIAAIASLNVSGGEVSDFWDVSRKIVGAANRLGLDTRKSIINPETLSRLNEMFLVDDRAFSDLQDKILLRDLHPVSDPVRERVGSLAEVRESEAYSQLRRFLLEHHELKI